jgi:hypothetical protein
MKFCVSVILVKTFDLYQKMSSPALCVKRDDVVDKTCFFTGWLDDTGVKSTVKCDQTRDTLAQCERAHLLTVINKDATRFWYTYHIVTIKNFIVLRSNSFSNQFRELGDKALKLPCLKDTEICPDNISHANVTTEGFNMCTMLMRLISDKITDKYNFLHNSVPTDWYRG